MNEVYVKWRGQPKWVLISHVRLFVESFVMVFGGVGLRSHFRIRPSVALSKSSFNATSRGTTTTTTTNKVMVKKR